MSFLSIEPFLWYGCYHGIDFIHAVSTQHRQKFRSLCNYNHTTFLWGIETINIISIFSRIPICETVCGMLVPVLIAPNLYMQTDPMLWNGFWYNLCPLYNFYILVFPLSSLFAVWFCYSFWIGLGIIFFVSFHFFQTSFVGFFSFLTVYCTKSQNYVIHINGCRLLGSGISLL